MRLIQLVRDAAGPTAVALGIVLVLTACGSDGPARDPVRSGDPGMTGSSGSSRDVGTSGSAPRAGSDGASPRPSGGNDSATGRNVVIPPDVVAEMDAFMKTPTTFLGDIVEVDMSRKPFLAASTFSIPRDVQRTDNVDGERGVVTITLTRTAAVTTMLDALPQVRIEGLHIIGVDRLVLRYWTKQTPDRPINLRARAAGNARILTEQPPSVDRGSASTLTIEVLDRGGGYRFRKASEMSP